MGCSRLETVIVPDNTSPEMRRKIKNDIKFAIGVNNMCPENYQMKTKILTATQARAPSTTNPSRVQRLFSNLFGNREARHPPSQAHSFPQSRRL